MQFFTDNAGKPWDVTDSCPVYSDNPYLRANTRKSLQDKVDQLEGRELSAIFGENIPLDLLVINRWKPDTCQCQVSFLWRKDVSDEDRVHHAHTSHWKCDTHASIPCMKYGSKDHYEALLSESAHKNLAVNATAEFLGVHPNSVGWSLNEKREVTVSHPRLTDDGMKGRVRQHLQSAVPNKTTYVE